MSYDIWLEVPYDVAYAEAIAGPAGDPYDGESWNYTSNMAPAWRAAGADLADFDGQTAGSFIGCLAAAIDVMREQRDDYAKRYDASNGWGSMETLIPALEELLAMFERWPGYTVAVWR
jgi:hypothetical protein